MSNDQLTHLDERGQAQMVDVGAKEITERLAVARGEVRLLAGTLRMIREGAAPKGDVLECDELWSFVGSKAWGTRWARRRFAGARVKSWPSP